MAKSKSSKRGAVHVDKQLERPLRLAIEFLEQEQLRYAIIGGVAVAQWGFARATQDVDIKVLVPDTDYAGVRARIEKRFPQKARLRITQNPFIVSVIIDKVIVDFLLTLPGYEEMLIARASRRNLGGFSAWICSAEDLIIQKVTAGRGKDVVDLEALLLGRYNKLDNAYIENWLSQFAEALEQPEMLQKYHELIARIEKLISASKQE